MTRNELVKAVQAAAEQGKLSCARAHELSAELGVPLAEIGKVCNELKIKIAACQLGCF